MKKMIIAVALVIASMITMVSMAGPSAAKDITYSNCEEHFSGLSWNINSYSVGGSLGTLKVRVHWNNCEPSTFYSPNRNNATYIGYTMDDMNCYAIDHVEFNVSTIEGLDPGVVRLDCANGSDHYAHKEQDISSPGFTFEKKDWTVKSRLTFTPTGRLTFGIAEDWNGHPTAQWGGRADITQ